MTLDSLATERAVRATSVGVVRRLAAMRGFGGAQRTWSNGK